MYEQFKARAEGVGAEVYRYETAAGAVEFLKSFLMGEGVADSTGCFALWADSSFLSGAERERLSEVPGLKFEVTRELAADARFGISRMQWALADTGTLVQDSTAIEQRLVSSLPAVHIALVPVSSIIADMPALLQRFDPKESAYISMITGPSRTADIERVLTIGVHGPERLIIVCVDM